MPSDTSRFTLITCFLIHFQFVIGCWWLAYDMETYWPIVFNVFRGMMYLLYPICGWIAEVYFTNFKLIKWSLIISLLSSITALVFSTARILKFKDGTTYLIVNSIVIVSCMYESNAIQFGMDQMIGASSQQLRSFVNWCFWCTHIGPLIMYSLSNLTVFNSTRCSVLNSPMEVYHYVLRCTSWVFLTCTILQLIVSISGLVLTGCYKRLSNHLAIL